MDSRALTGKAWSAPDGVQTRTPALGSRSRTCRRRTLRYRHLHAKAAQVALDSGVAAKRSSIATLPQFAVAMLCGDLSADGVRQPKPSRVIELLHSYLGLGRRRICDRSRSRRRL